MANLGNQQIQDTYNGLLKTEDSTQGISANGRTQIEDGDGNTTALKLGQDGNGADINGQLSITGGFGINTPSITSPNEDPNTGIPETTCESALILDSGVFIKAGSAGSSIKVDRLQGATTDSNGGTTIDLQSDLIASNSNAKIGIRTTSPNSALDVNGAINTDSINVRSQQFFIPQGLNYVKFGTYGQGNFFQNSDPSNDRYPRFSLGVTDNGILVEDVKTIVIKLQGTGFNQLNTNPHQILPPLQNSFYDIKEIITLKDGDGNGNWVQANTGRTDPYAIGQFEGQQTGGLFRQYWSMALHICEAQGQTLYNPQRTTTKNTPPNAINRKNRGVYINSIYPDRMISATTNQVHYIMIRYKVHNAGTSFIQNVDQTIGT